MCDFSKAYFRNVLKTQDFQEAGLLRGQVFFLVILTVVLTAVFCSSILCLDLHFLCVSGGRFVRVGGGFMEFQGRAKGERLVAAIADEPMELTDTATKICLTPDLEVKKG